ncbi:DUF1513 domain-containing protein [uncultured Litoreibacter sp.]|uniref:DUF1513 domain-containing protein n=1 Tax=uncultured Litoreibacter sp. TaxID=1392394 RepID=UPI003457F5FF
MKGYQGSVAISEDAVHIATGSPHAGVIQTFQRTKLVEEVPISDVCGVALQFHRRHPSYEA